MTMDFSKEPPHSDYLTAKSEQPWNAEPELSELIKYSLTPEELIFSRNHGKHASPSMQRDATEIYTLTGPIKPIDAAEFTVKIDGPNELVQKTLEYTLADLKLFEKVEIVAALQVKRFIF